MPTSQMWTRSMCTLNRFSVYESFGVEVVHHLLAEMQVGACTVYSDTTVISIGLFIRALLAQFLLFNNSVHVVIDW